MVPLQHLLQHLQQAGAPVKRPLQHLQQAGAPRHQLRLRDTQRALPPPRTLTPSALCESVLPSCSESVLLSCSNSPSWPRRSRCLVSVVTHTHAERSACCAVVAAHTHSALCFAVPLLGVPSACDGCYTLLCALWLSVLLFCSLQRRDVITKHQFALQLIRDSTWLLEPTHSEPTNRSDQRFTLAAGATCLLRLTERSRCRVSAGTSTHSRRAGSAVGGSLQDARRHLAMPCLRCSAHSRGDAASPLQHTPSSAVSPL